MKRIVYLQKIGLLDQSILIKLKKDLEKALKVFIDSVEILPDFIPLTNLEYNPKKRQYKASLVMKELIKHINKKQYFRTIGVIDKDIYSELKKFVFGVAKLPKNQSLKSSGFALISIVRLKEEFYRRPEDHLLFELRVLKEAIHELGHTFGLSHCNNSCIMKFSNYIEQTDKKPSKFCESCLNKLEEFFSNLK
jgi:archaemetzincin